MSSHRRTKAELYKRKLLNIQYSTELLVNSSVSFLEAACYLKCIHSLHKGKRIEAILCVSSTSSHCLVRTNYSVQKEKKKREKGTTEFWTRHSEYNLSCSLEFLHYVIAESNDRMFRNNC
jgi:hypothetical protein